MRLPHVILLNGATSSGKTSIARGLLAALPQPYLHFGIDNIFPALPPSLCETPLGYWFEQLPDGSMPVHLGEGFLQVARVWRRMIRAGVDAGLRFVIDDVWLTPEDRPDWRAALAGLDVLFVGVRCELAELQRREIARGDRGLGQAQSQYVVTHSYGAYDLEIDTTATPTADCVAAILKHLAASSGLRTRPKSRPG
jgi:chloramphenicol 3-O phosphotransferase